MNQQLAADLMHLASVQQAVVAVVVVVANGVSQQIPSPVHGSSALELMPS